MYLYKAIDYDFVGNVQGVLIRGNRTYRLSKDHTPHNPRERERVVKAGEIFCHVYPDISL